MNKRPAVGASMAAWVTGLIVTTITIFLAGDNESSWKFLVVAFLAYSSGGLGQRFLYEVEKQQKLDEEEVL